MTSKSMVIKIAGFAIAILIFLGFYIKTLSNYDVESQEHYLTIVDGKTLGPDYVAIRAKVTAIDLNKGEMKVRLEFNPEGKFESAEKYTLGRDVNVIVYSAVGKHEFPYKKGKRMDSIEVALDLYGGEATDYPYDQHNADLNITISAAKEKPPEKKEGDAAAPPPDKPADKPADKPEAAAGDDEEIPIAMDWEASITGLKLEANRTDLPDKDYIELAMKISRSRTVFFFTSFVMVAMWLVTIAVVTMMGTIVIGGRKIEIGMFSFLGSLLFAFPGLRNAQPGAPPIGAFSDYVAFFWVESIVAICLITILSIWIVRQPK